MIRLLFLLLLCLPLAAENSSKRQLGGRSVYLWTPSRPLKAPVVLFSHGWRGVNHQTADLMRRLARAGFFVVAPNHRDSLVGSDVTHDPQVSFDEPTLWTPDTYRDRAEDLAAVWSALRGEFKTQIDPDRLVLMGHSLGGYTCLGLSGAIPQWDRFGFHPKALVCFSPYTRPYLEGGPIQLRAPVMYQGGTEDDFITPHLRKSGGTYERSSRPKVYVEFEGALHTSWTVLDPDYEDLIFNYTLAFLKRHVLGEAAPLLQQRQSGVSDLRVED
ncbi:alpha/beta fold hydrolase [bacterium]|nr:alpha/beta fold hydrolase [bacterium]